MQPLLVLGITFVLTIAFLYLVFRMKPRQKVKHLKEGYEVFVMGFGMLVLFYAAWRYLVLQEIFYLLLALGGIYISMIHVISNKVGRYDTN
jgi:uncharacterized membrane protein YidH (DUF202 family)